MGGWGDVYKTSKLQGRVSETERARKEREKKERKKTKTERRKRAIKTEYQTHKKGAAIEGKSQDNTVQ